jgi:geranylgeranyl reductase family protein
MTSAPPWDTVIVGAGPAGAIAALHLAGGGRRVTVLDRHVFPRDKVCGDGLIPDALRCLERAGLRERVTAHGYATGTVSVYSPHQIRADVPGEFVTLKRETLDAMVLAEAVRRGAVFRQMQVREVTTDDQGVTVSGGGHAVRGRVAVLATGADVSLLASLGMLHRSRASGVAGRCYVRSPEPLAELIVSFDKSVLPGYGWIFPLGNDEYNVGVGAFTRGTRKQPNVRGMFERFTRRFPVARRLLTRAGAVSPLKGARLRCGLRGAAVHDGGRVVAVGESIGTTFPFTGEGIGKAMETAEIAVRLIHRALDADDFAPLREIAGLIERDLAPRYAGYALAEEWATKAWLIDAIARRVRRSDRLRRAAAGILDETIDPRVLFSWRNVVASWKR